MGCYIVEFEQDGNKRAKYGTAMLSNLAKILRARVGRGYSRPNLNNIRKFYLMFPKCQTSDKSIPNFQTSDKLTWSHICELITIDDDLEREFYTNGMDSNLFVSKYELFLPNKEELRKMVKGLLKQ